MMTRPKRPKRMSERRKTLIGREAVGWIMALEAKRRPVPAPDMSELSGQRRGLIEMERFQHWCKFQAYDIAMALNQIFELVKHLERRKIPRDVKEPLGAFLTSMRSDRLIHLRDAFAHYDEFLAGTMSSAQRAKKVGTWEEQQAERPDRVVASAGSKKIFKSMLQGIGFRFNVDEGATVVALMGRSYYLMDAYSAAIALGPPLARWSGKLWFRLDEAQEDTPMPLLSVTEAATDRRPPLPKHRPEQHERCDDGGQGGGQ